MYEGAHQLTDVPTTLAVGNIGLSFRNTITDTIHTCSIIVLLTLCSAIIEQ
jgi:hypothetical protein